MKISQEIRQVRDERQCSIYEAKNVVVRRRLLDRIERAQSVDDLKIVLTAVVKSIRSFDDVESW